MSITTTDNRRVLPSDERKVIDLTLADVGAKLKELVLMRMALNRQIRDLEQIQDARLRELRAQQHLTVIDAGDQYSVANPNPDPSQFQFQVIGLFKSALLGTDQNALRDIYAIAIEANCHLTTWRTDYREDVMTAFARRMAELEG